MIVSTEKFIECAKKFVNDEIVSQLGNANARFFFGMGLTAADAKTLPLLAGVFPELGGMIPLAKASGVICDSGIDVDRLESILSGGFGAADDEFVFSKRLPAFIDPEQTEISVKLTPRVWEMFKSGLS